MKLYVRADCLRLEKVDPETGEMEHVRLITFEEPSLAIKTLNWCDKCSSVEDAVLRLIARCKEIGAVYEDIWNSREVIPAHFGDKLKYKRVGFHVD